MCASWSSSSSAPNHCSAAGCRSPPVSTSICSTWPRNRPPTASPGGYKPNDFDNKFPGPLTVREALAQSRNIPAVEALQFVTVPEMLATAHRFGIEDLRQPERYGLSVTLGGGEVKLLDLTYAYSVFANSGKQTGTELPPDRRQEGFRQFDPASILKVTDSSGKVLYEYRPNGAQVADPRRVY